MSIPTAESDIDVELDDLISLSASSSSGLSIDESGISIETNLSIADSHSDPLYVQQVSPPQVSMISLDIDSSDQITLASSELDGLSRSSGDYHKTEVELSGVDREIKSCIIVVDGYYCCNWCQVRVYFRPNHYAFTGHVQSQRHREQVESHSASLSEIADNEILCVSTGQEAPVEHMDFDFDETNSNVSTELGEICASSDCETNEEDVYMGSEHSSEPDEYMSDDDNDFQDNMEHEINNGAYYPVASRELFLMTHMFSTPGQNFSRNAKKAILWWARQMHTPNVPTLHAVEEAIKALRTATGCVPSQYKTMDSTPYFANSIVEQIKREIGNKHVIDSAHTLPQRTLERNESYQSDKCNKDPAFKAPMIRNDFGDFYVGDIALFRKYDDQHARQHTSGFIHSM
ncbi:hypothetical protein HK096_008908 [Nowakowskiella sp. JEL0078]|nr:hypothetical protein HK096_008908 [Nowakowskiella sp. JEL0078]